MAKKANNISIDNKRATFEYAIVEKHIAGIQLTGTEIKSIRAGKAGLVDSYCFFTKDELWIKNMHISEYEKGSYNNHAPTRDRKLLLTRAELNKLQKKIKDQGLTIIALKLFIAESTYAKLEIALAKGKKNVDKRESIKEKDVKRDLDRKFKL